MLGRIRKLARCVDGSTMIEYSTLVALMLVIGYFIYHGFAQNSRRIVAETGERIDASWKRAVWPGTTTSRDGATTVIRRADRIEIKYKDLDKRVTPAAGPR